MGAFIQEEILGMAWLSRLVARILGNLGLDLSTRLGASVHFFFYDVVKISFLLCSLIFMISFIQSFFPPERTRGILGRFSGIWANCLGALLGTVTPFCSCSSIPLFMGFTGAGLPLGVTFSFLISSPMVDLASLVLLMSIFGPRVAVAYVVLGLLVAIVGGAIIERMGMEAYVEDFIREAPHIQSQVEEVTFGQRLVFARDSMVDTFRKVFPYILVGVCLGAAIHNYLPEAWVVDLLGGNNPLGVVLATGIGIPMYADIFGTIPVAEALLSKGAALGTVLAFMMAVTTLSLPSLILLRKAVKPRLLGTFVLICGLGIILVGYFFNQIQTILL